METDTFKYQFSLWAGSHHVAEEINAGVTELPRVVKAPKRKRSPASRSGEGPVPPGSNTM